MPAATSELLAGSAQLRSTGLTLLTFESALWQSGSSKGKACRLVCNYGQAHRSEVGKSLFFLRNLVPLGGLCGLSADSLPPGSELIRAGVRETLSRNRFDNP